MKEFNLGRLMDSCCVDINSEYYNELFDYLIDLDVDLNTLNIDDLVVNDIYYMTEEELVDKEGKYYILKKDDEGAWVL